MGEPFWTDGVMKRKIYETQSAVKRWARNRDGQYFASFSSAISRRTAKTIGATMRRNWRIRRRTDQSLIALAGMSNPEIWGWIPYYGSFHRSALYSVFRSLDFALVQWVVREVVPDGPVQDSERQVEPRSHRVRQPTGGLRCGERQEGAAPRCCIRGHRRERGSPPSIAE